MNRNVAKVMALAVVLAVMSVFGAQAVAAEGGPGVVTINTASDAQLMLLPGIGPSKAQAIVEYRAKKQFASADEIVKVKGIGPNLLARLRPYIVTEGQTTLKSSLKKGRAR